VKPPAGVTLPFAKPVAASRIFWQFLRLGLTSFGGPIAHLGYFRAAFVTRLRWLDEAEYAALLALCQCLPGPASSQVGFGIGLSRAGWLGGLAAWTGFTLPSALLMFAISLGAAQFAQFPLAISILHGLELAAVAVVGHAVFNMAKSLCPDWPRRIIAVVALAMLVLLPSTAGQIFVLLAGAAAGEFLYHGTDVVVAKQPRLRSHTGPLICLGVFAALLVISLLPAAFPAVALFNAFYRSGALVFGGGHVVLPLLNAATVLPGWISPSLFLAGYGAAQAMPGPLFSVAAFLGSISITGPGGAAGAAIALVAIFLPGLLLVAALLPYWTRLQRNRTVAACLQGVNAAVVGMLAFALLNLIMLGAVTDIADGLIAAAAFAALLTGRVPPLAVVAACVALRAALNA